MWSLSLSVCFHTTHCFQDLATLLVKLSTAPGDAGTRNPSPSRSPAEPHAPAPGPVASLAPVCLSTLLALVAEDTQPLLQGGLFERAGVLPAAAALAGSAYAPQDVRYGAVPEPAV